MNTLNAQLHYLSVGGNKYNLIGMLVLALIIAVIIAVFGILGSRLPAGKKFLWILFVIIPIINVLGVIAWFGGARSKWKPND